MKLLYISQIATLEPPPSIVCVDLALFERLVLIIWCIYVTDVYIIDDMVPHPLNCTEEKIQLINS